MDRLYITLVNFMQGLHTDERGATGVEYGIMVAAIAAVIVAVAFSLGVKVDTAFDTVVAEFP